MIKNIIFDLGGVLMTDVPLKKIAQELSIRFSISEQKLHSHLYPTEHWNLLTLGRISEDEYWERFVADSEIGVDQEELKNKVRTELHPIEENVRLVPRLKERFNLAILSNHSREWSRFMLKEFDFFNHFEQIIFSCDVGLRKPDPRIYELVLAKLRSKPDECLFIDDKKRNTEAAEQIGMKTVVLENPSNLREKLSQLGITFEDEQPPIPSPFYGEGEQRG